MPRRRSAEQIIVTSAPAMSILRASEARWIPLVAAKLAAILSWRMAIRS
jgi:hypothetical protein